MFRLYKLWKAFRLWKRAVNQHKFGKARAALERNLFALSPVFQDPLRRFHGLCFELSHMRMQNLAPGAVRAGLGGLAGWLGGWVVGWEGSRGDGEGRGGVGEGSGAVGEGSRGVGVRERQDGGRSVA